MLLNKIESKLILIIDVQSSIVRGSLVILSKDQLPTVLFTYISDLAKRSDSDDAYITKITLKAVNETIQSVLRHIHLKHQSNELPRYPKKISEIHFVLSSPWIISQAKVLSRNFEKETEITQKLVTDLINTNRQQNTVISSKDHESIIVMEQKIFDIQLNHYSIADWEHKKTKFLDVSFTESVANKKTLEYFSNQGKHVVGSSKIYFHSSLLLQYISIEKVLDPGQDYCLIHVHGSETDVSVIRNKSCVYFGSYSYGVNKIIEQIATLTKNGKQVAESLLVLYVGGKLDLAQKNKDIEIVEKVSLDWFNSLNNLLKESNIDIKPPMSIIVTASLHDNYFAQSLKKFNSDIPVYILSMDDLLHKVAFSNLAIKKRLIALHAIAIHSLLEDKL